MGKGLVLLAVAACLVVPGTALAQDDGQQSLPDPNRGEQSDGKSEKASPLPDTGVSVPLLLAGGVALLAAGVAVRPIRRRRRAYRSDVWFEAVRAGSSPGSD